MANTGLHGNNNFQEADVDDDGTGHNNTQHLDSFQPGQYKDQVILASGGYDHTIRYWNAEKGFCEKIIQQPDNSHVSMFSH